LKICIVSDPYYPYPSGVSEYTFYLAKYLRRLGHKVTVVTTRYPKYRPDADVIRFGRVLMIPMNKSYATMSFGLEIPIKIRHLIRKENFDIIHLNGPFPPSMSFIALHYSNTANVSVLLNAGFSHGRTGAGLVKKMFRKYNDKTDAVIALSPSARDSYSAYIPGQYHIIPPGVDYEVFNDRVKPIVNLPPGKPVILFLGRLDKRKGAMKLIQALPLIRRDLPDCILIIAGRGPMDDKCRNTAKQLGVANAVHFTGFIRKEDIPRYYAAADVYCSPALGGESFGIVLLEAMAVGTPVCASRIPGYQDVIKDGETGLLFDPRDPEAIAQALVRILKDPALKTSLRRNGWEFVKKFTWEEVTRRIEEVYREAIDRFKKRSGGAEEKRSRGEKDSKQSRTYT
jgi:phosphatidylinositol alpha-mannosyltransferase